MAKLPPINFSALADALLRMAHSLVPQWLPGGVQRGHEYQCADLSGGEGSSCSVNLNNGRWADFAGSDEDTGNDLISLYAAIHNLGAGEAAIELARAHGLEDIAGIVKTGAAPVVRQPPPAPPPKPQQPAEKWATQIPVPPYAPHPRFEHHHRTSADVVFTSAYMVDGCCLGYVVRFRTSDGGKDDLPYTWCVSESKGGAMWRWRTWDEPRPLYYPGGRSIKAVQGDRPQPPTVIVVEGERKGRVLQALLDAHAPDVYVVVSWPGGCKVWAKALWEWLKGCTVLLWPDCDSQRERLTPSELKQYTDPSAKALAQATKPFLPREQQPGWKAMVGLGQLLVADWSCQVQILPTAEPGERDDGWDAADAIEKDGWGFDEVLAYFGQAGPLPAPKPGKDVQTSAPAESTPAPAADAGKGGGGGGGGRKPPKSDDGDLGVGGDEDDAFREHLEFICRVQECKVWHLKINRKMVIAALRKSPLLKGCVGFNELTEGPETREPWPWRRAAAPMIDSDPLRLGDFLSEHYGLPGASKASLEEAIDTVADENRFHPVRDWLDGLQHDGKTRIDRWLIHVLRLKPDELQPGLRRYLELVGRYMLLGLVARVLKPGCKFDYTPVLEGKGGLGKSTLIKVLVGDKFFSDTHFEIGSGKDAYEQLAGIWGYELSEMTALQRADSEQSKQFLSSTEDRYRGAYGRYVVAHPRQCVIFCSTNKYQYLRDLSGNRRYWPFVVLHRPDLDWLRERREQLFAEAVALFKAGERIYPTPEEEDEYFVPEQSKRLLETAVQSRLWRLLTRTGPWPGEGKSTAHLNQNTKFVAIDEMVEALGTDAGKSSAQLENQIRSWLDSMGWVSAREGGGLRRRGFRRPAVWPPVLEDDEAGAGPVGGQAQQEGGEPGVGEPSAGGADGAPF